MNPTLKKQLLTHVLIILGFLAITILVHYPTFLSGKQISQHDISQARGGNQQLKEYKEVSGEEALWNPNMFSGMPAYLTGLGYPGDLLQYVYKFFGLGMTHPPAILFISMVSFYILLLVFKVRPLIAAGGAIAFGLNGFNIIGIMAGHNAKIAAVALMPLVLAGIQLTFSGKKWIGSSLTALALGLQIRTNHPQITYYLLLIVVAFGINLLIQVVRKKDYRPFIVQLSLLIVAAILAVGANLGRLSTTLEYSQHSIRGKSELLADQSSSSGLDREYAFRYSNGITEPLFLFVPNIFGGSSQQSLSTKSEVAKALRNGGYNRSQIEQQVKAVPTYWGDQPLTAPYYAGTVTIVLFILGVVILPRKQKVWLIVLAILGIAMSWGKNFTAFNDLLFDYLPGYNKFRSVTFTIIITIFAMNLLGFIALEKLIQSDWNKPFRKKVFLALGISIALPLLLLLFSGALSYRGSVDAQLPDWFVTALREDRQSLLSKDSLRTLFFVAIFSATVWGLKIGKIKTSYAVMGVSLVIFVDSFLLSRRFIQAETFTTSPVKSFFQQTEADQAILASTKPGDRILNLQNPFNENRTSYYHASIGGYHGAKIRRYQDLIDYCLSNQMQEAIQTLQSQSLDFSNLHILNMLNAKYFYAGNQRNGVFPNNTANGAAWTVSEIVTANSADDEINKTCQINTKTQAVIDQSKFDIPQISGTGTIQLTEKSPNRVVYQANIDGGTAIGIFSEVYYPKGWKVMVNGTEAEMIRANYVLRALELPAGNYSVEFEFSPRAYTYGNRIMLVSSLLIILLFVTSIGLEIRSHSI